MDPVTATVVVISIATCFLAWWFLWPRLRDYFSGFLIPRIRARLGDSIADGLANLVFFIDERDCAARRLAEQGAQFLKERVLRIQTTYIKTSATTATAQTEAIVATTQGMATRTVTEQEVRYEELPPEIRSELIRQNSARGTMDVREAVLRKAEEKGIQLEVTYG